MPEQTHEQVADRLADDALKTFSDFGSKLVGAGLNFQEFQSIQGDAQTIATIGGQAADNIRKLREDQSQPEDFRAQRIAAIEAGTKELMGDMRVAVLKRLERLENQLLQEVKPGPEADTGKSLLARQELETAISAQPQGKPMLATLMELAINNPEYGAEIMGTWGAAKMQAAGEGESVGALQRNVALTLARVPRVTDTPRHQAVKAALRALPQVKGQTEGFHQAGKRRIEGSKPQPGIPVRGQLDTLIPKASAFQSQVRQKP